MMGLSTQRPAPRPPHAGRPRDERGPGVPGRAGARHGVDRGHRRSTGRPPAPRCGPASAVVQSAPVADVARARAGRQRQRPHRVPGPPGRRARRPLGRRPGLRRGRRAGCASRSGPRASTSPASRCWTPAACRAAPSCRPASSATCWRWPPAGTLPGAARRGRPAAGGRADRHAARPLPHARAPTRRRASPGPRPAPSPVPARWRARSSTATAGCCCTSSWPTRSRPAWER